MILKDDLLSFRENFDTSLEAFLKKEIESYQKISSSPEIIALLSHILTVSHGGKRLRPFLVWSFFKHSNKEQDDTSIMPLLLAIELFHIFCLVHDDVMDRAKMRHGVKTVHALAESDFYPNDIQTAESQAILVGDIVFNSVFKLLQEYQEQNPETGTSVKNIFHTLIDEVCIGQMIDVHLTSKKSATTEEILEKNRLKTARYSFARPLHIGATVAKRNDLETFVMAFGEKLGILYQIQDDLLDIMGDTKETKKTLFQDATQNQHTVLSAFIRNSDESQAAVLDSYTRKEDLNDADITALQNLFVSSGAIAYAEAMILEYESAARQLFTDHTLNEADTEFFTQILSLVHKRKQ